MLARCGEGRGRGSVASGPSAPACGTHDHVHDIWHDSLREHALPSLRVDVVYQLQQCLPLQLLASAGGGGGASARQGRCSVGVPRRAVPQVHAGGCAALTEPPPRSLKSQRECCTIAASCGRPPARRGGAGGVSAARRCRGQCRSGCRRTSRLAEGVSRSCGRSAKDTASRSLMTEACLWRVVVGAAARLATAQSTGTSLTEPCRLPTLAHFPQQRQLLPLPLPLPLRRTPPRSLLWTASCAGCSALTPCWRLGRGRRRQLQLPFHSHKGQCGGVSGQSTGAGAHAQALEGATRFTLCKQTLAGWVVGSGMWRGADARRHQGASGVVGVQLQRWGGALQLPGLQGSTSATTPHPHCQPTPLTIKHSCFQPPSCPAPPTRTCLRLPKRNETQPWPRKLRSLPLTPASLHTQSALRPPSTAALPRPGRQVFSCAAFPWTSLTPRSRMRSEELARWCRSPLPP